MGPITILRRSLLTSFGLGVATYAAVMLIPCFGLGFFLFGAIATNMVRTHFKAALGHAAPIDFASTIQFGWLSILVVAVGAVFLNGLNSYHLGPATALSLPPVSFQILAGILLFLVLGWLFAPFVVQCLVHADPRRAEGYADNLGLAYTVTRRIPWFERIVPIGVLGLFFLLPVVAYEYDKDAGMVFAVGGAGLLVPIVSAVSVATYLRYRIPEGAGEPEALERGPSVMGLMMFCALSTLTVIGLSAYAAACPTPLPSVSGCTNARSWHFPEGHRELRLGDVLITAEDRGVRVSTSDGGGAGYFATGESPSLFLCEGMAEGEHDVLVGNTYVTGNFRDEGGYFAGRILRVDERGVRRDDGLVARIGEKFKLGLLFLLGLIFFWAFAARAFVYRAAARQLGALEPATLGVLDGSKRLLEGQLRGGEIVREGRKVSFAGATLEGPVSLSFGDAMMRVTGDVEALKENPTLCVAGSFQPAPESFRASARVELPADAKVHFGARKEALRWRIRRSHQILLFALVPLLLCGVGAILSFLACELW